MSDEFTPDMAEDSSIPSIDVRRELEKLLRGDTTRIGDVYRLDGPGVSADRIADELGVPTSGFVSNIRTAIRAVLEGAIPQAPVMAKNVASKVASLGRNQSLSLSARGYLADLHDRISVVAASSAPSPAAPTDKVDHAWKVYGSNVSGEDMVPIWRTKATISLAAKFLRPVEPDVTRDELKGFIEEDYRASGYAARQEKLDEFYSFLARMHPGDLVVTVSQGKAHFGTVTGDAEYVQSSDGRSNLRRPVKWESVTRPSADLPLEIASRLNAQGEVVDLTPQIDALREIMGRRRAAKPATGLNLPDASADLARRLHVPQEWLQECVELLRDRPQLIFYGPPGTGKTYIAKELARHLAGESNVKIVQFHPAYSYEDFFEGYRPAQQVGGQVGFELRPGPLRTIVDRAIDNPDAVYVLIIDEINRGNLAKIFGELYFLLEYRNESIDLLYGSDNTEPFMLPRNVILIGTMNTADRSIALVDAAMRRRFAFLPLHPSEPPTSGILRSWLQATNRTTEAADLLDILNARIDDEDFKIGPSYLMRDAVYHEKGLDRVWRTAILPLLEEFHYGDRGIDVQLRYGLDALRKKLSTNDVPESDDDTNHSDTD